MANLFYYPPPQSKSSSFLWIGISIVSKLVSLLPSWHTCLLPVQPAWYLQTSSQKPFPTLMPSHIIRVKVKDLILILKTTLAGSGSFSDIFFHYPWGSLTLVPQVSIQFLEQVKYVPTLNPSYFFFPLPAMFFLQISTELTPSLQ